LAGLPQFRPTDATAVRSKRGINGDGEIYLVVIPSSFAPLLGRSLYAALTTFGVPSDEAIRTSMDRSKVRESTGRKLLPSS
jgi:hypothetical protein